MESSNKLGEVWEECRKCCPWGELAIVELGAFKHLYVFHFKIICWGAQEARLILYSSPGVPLMSVN